MEYIMSYYGDFVTKRGNAYEAALENADTSWHEEPDAKKLLEKYVAACEAGDEETICEIDEQLEELRGDYAADYAPSDENGAYIGDPYDFEVMLPSVDEVLFNTCVKHGLTDPRFEEPYTLTPLDKARFDAANANWDLDFQGKNLLSAYVEAIKYNEGARVFNLARKIQDFMLYWAKDKAPAFRTGQAYQWDEGFAIREMYARMPKLKTLVSAQLCREMTA
jgi:hypothetical protein